MLYTQTQIPRYQIVLLICAEIREQGNEKKQREQGNKAKKER